MAAAAFHFPVFSWCISDRGKGPLTLGLEDEICSCVLLGKTLNLSDTHCLHLTNGLSDASCRVTEVTERDIHVQAPLPSPHFFQLLLGLLLIPGHLAVTLLLLTLVTAKFLGPEMKVRSDRILNPITIFFSCFLNSSRPASFSLDNGNSLLLLCLLQIPFQQMTEFYVTPCPVPTWKLPASSQSR